jgi:DNA repair protein RecO (recombination protein O)
MPVGTRLSYQGMGKRTKMEIWSDQGIVLSARSHGEGGAVVSVLTESHGRYAGYVHGARSLKLRGMVEPGTLVNFEWKARIADQLGTMTFDGGRNLAGLILDDPLKLAALLSACSLCDAALPEREGHSSLFRGMKVLCWRLCKPRYGGLPMSLWEIAFLRELGFGMDLGRCVAGGDKETLTYVSPKSGCAVSLREGYPYRDKLLKLPEFLKPHSGEGAGEPEDVAVGLKMTGYFLQNWVFAHHSGGVPEARLRFESLFVKTCPAAIESAA